MCHKAQYFNVSLRVRSRLCHLFSLSNSKSTNIMGRVSSDVPFIVHWPMTLTVKPFYSAEMGGVLHHTRTLYNAKRGSDVWIVPGRDHGAGDICSYL